MVCCIVLTCASIAVGTAAAGAQQAETARQEAEERILLHDDFESGISEHWLAVSDGIDVVADVADGSVVNHVARLHQGEGLVSPPVPPGDWKGGRKATEALKRWDDYEFRFRFRVRGFQRAHWPQNRVIIMTVKWRINPQDSANPFESHLLYFQVNRSNGRWMLRGPLVGWYNGQQPFTHIIRKNPRRPIRGIEPVTDAWVTIRIRAKDDHVVVCWDNKLVFEGRDIRCPYGGVRIGARLPGYVHVDALEIDDVVVRSLADEEPVMPENLTKERPK